MDSPRQRQFEFPTEPLYSLHSTQSAAFARAERAVSVELKRLRMRVLISKLELEELIGAVGREVSACEADLNEAETVGVLRLTREWGRTQSHVESGKVLLVRLSLKAPVYVAITDEPYRFWHAVLGRALGRCYPYVSYPSFSTREIHDALSALVHELQVEGDALRIKSLSLHSRIADPTAERQTQVERVWTDWSLDFAFDSVEEQNAAIRAVYFETRNGADNSAAGHISRDGEVVVETGFNTIRNAVLHPFCSIASARFTQLDNRTRVREHGFATRPFFIEFPYPVFDSAERQAQFVRVLETMPHASHAVMHSNPYVHVALFDRLEGTNCDVYVLSNSRIGVVPQTRSTPTALSRLYEHISKGFGEGTVIDYDEVYP